MPSADPANSKWCRFPRLSGASFTENGGIQKMHGLDVSAERKFTRGFSFQSGWTWAKDLADAHGGQDAAAIENPYCRQCEKSNVSSVFRHRFVTSAVWEIPFGTGKRFRARLHPAVRQSAGNWSISDISVFQTGCPLTASFSGPDPSGTRTFGGRADRVGNWELSNLAIDRWFDKAAFAVPPAGRFGNSAPNVLSGPGVANFDFGLFKDFSLWERGRLQLRMTATNFLNHPNFGDPNTNISSGNVGRITGVRGRDSGLGAGRRLIRLGARIEF